MEIRELRIGNFVYGIDGNTHTIEEIGFRKIITKGVSVNSISTHNDFPFPSLRPIGVTTWWVSQFGFKTRSIGNNENHFLINERLELVVDSAFETNGYKILFDGKDLTYIKYIHEIQNLYFAITKRELIIG